METDLFNKGEADTFIDVAIRNGLLEEENAQQIISHSERENVRASDAALSLSILEMYEIDAIKLLLTPNDLAPGYELTELIGCGASGMVFRARQRALDRDVAIKTINIRTRNAATTSSPRIQREAKSIARLQHPNIVTAYDSGFFQGRFCIAMELVEGETLSSYIERNSRINEETTWQIARQVASALAHANEAGVIHRDIKPSNLLIAQAPLGTDLKPGIPLVKVADFGLALDNEGKSDQLTATGTTLGTPAYVAPEQLQDTHVDQHADIYSLGATVFHMLAGKPPCADRSPMKTIIRKTIGDDKWRGELPDDVSDASRDLFLAMTETEVENRIGDYQQLLDLMDDLVASLGTSRPSPVHAGTSTRRSLLQNPQSTADNNSPLGSGSFEVSLSSAADHSSVHPDGQQTAAQRRRRFVPAVSLAVATLAGTLAMCYLLWPKAPIEMTRWESNGIALDLYDGESVPLQFKHSGAFTPLSIDEGRVLQGSKDAQMTIPIAHDELSSPNVRLSVGVVTSGNSRAELAIVPVHEDGTPDDQDLRGMVRIGPRSASLLEPRGTSDDGLVNLEEIANVVWPDTPSDETFFQRVSLFRQQGLILININNQKLGSLTFEQEDLPGVTLRCPEGPVRFADINIVELVAPPSN